MSLVAKKTKSLYLNYMEESDTELKKEAKKAYIDELKSLTIGNKEYEKIVREFARVMAKVNQDALGIVNSGMTSAYVIGYNAFVDDLKEAGFRVYG